jgi:hypothetical protein
VLVRVLGVEVVAFSFRRVAGIVTGDGRAFLEEELDDPRRNISEGPKNAGVLRSSRRPRCLGPRRGRAGWEETDGTNRLLVRRCRTHTIGRDAEATAIRVERLNQTELLHEPVDLIGVRWRGRIQVRSFGLRSFDASGSFFSFEFGSSA